MFGRGSAISEALILPDSPLPATLFSTSFFGGSEENPVINFSALFDRTQAIPDLTLTKSHAGNFTQGQAGATYTVTARNIGIGATTGTVTVVDNFPPALIPTAAAGSGWTCSISSQLGHLHSQRLPGSRSQLPADHPDGQCGLHRSCRGRQRSGCYRRQ